VEIHVRKIYCVDRAVPVLPISIGDAARSEAEIEQQANGCVFVTVRETSAFKRNANVHEILKRIRFNSVSKSKRIESHDRIIWLGDLNYCHNLSYEKMCDLISKSDWSRLLECDQLGEQLVRVNQNTRLNNRVLDIRKPANQAIISLDVRPLVYFVSASAMFKCYFSCLSKLSDFLQLFSMFL
ncbi:DNAse I-like superfamily protein, partial [Tanacetum coccineum]